MDIIHIESQLIIRVYAVNVFFLSYVTTDELFRSIILRSLLRAAAILTVDAICVYFVLSAEALHARVQFIAEIACIHRNAPFLHCYTNYFHFFFR